MSGIEKSRVRAGNFRFGYTRTHHYRLHMIYFDIPGRMALLVTLFLVLVNIFNTVTTNTPKAEGLTAIEAWMLSCILFVFASLTEYACLLFSRGIGTDEDAQNLTDTSAYEDPCR